MASATRYISSAAPNTLISNTERDRLRRSATIEIHDAVDLVTVQVAHV